jgi:hypothetical protein
MFSRWTFQKVLMGFLNSPCYLHKALPKRPKKVGRCFKNATPEHNVTFQVFFPLSPSVRLGIYVQFSMTGALLGCRANGGRERAQASAPSPCRQYTPSRCSRPRLTHVAQPCASLTSAPAISLTSAVVNAPSPKERGPRGFPAELNSTQTGTSTCIL